MLPNPSGCCLHYPTLCIYADNECHSRNADCERPGLKRAAVQGSGFQFPGKFGLQLSVVKYRTNKKQRNKQ